jgi:prefoldin subunit 5
VEELDMIKIELDYLKNYAQSLESLLKTVMSTKDVLEYLNTKKETLQNHLDDLKSEKSLILNSRLSDETKSQLTSVIQQRIENIQSELERIDELITQYGGA